MTALARVPRRTVLSAVTVVVALAATVVVYGITPHGDDILAPFNERGSIGDTLTGRTLTGSVTAVGLASSFDPDSTENGWTGPTTGTWVVVEAEIAATTEPSSLYRPSLTIGDVTYYASERLSLVTLDSNSVRPGIPSRGYLIFEVADSVLDSAAAADAEVGISSSYEAVLDSRLVVDVDLSDLPVESDVVLSRPEDVLP